MLLHFIQLCLHFLLRLTLVSRHILNLDLEGHVFGFDGATVFAFLQIGLIRKGPTQYLDSALVESDVEGVLLHFEGVLVVDDGIEGVDEGNWGQFGRLDAVLESGFLGESGVDGGLDHLEEDEALAPVPDALMLRPQLLHLVLVTQDEHLRCLQILYVFLHNVMQRSLATAVLGLVEEFKQDVAVAPFVDLLIKDVEQLVVVVLLLLVVVLELREDFGLELVVVESL
jgi:hypothetical protein